ncbi:hypothetical protein PIB30_015086 [Stylosanthes scabra]|uniref:Rad60/SUMO-like domain-containing protein n=1 Tax=Stylosanthes scabra TaxID=79078 RepID=A0ABU6Q7M0_9FABA|nr:hypothetical protein [Stylosanthes scabra]
MDICWLRFEVVAAAPVMLPHRISVLVSRTNIASYKFNILVTAKDMFHKLRQSAKNFGDYFSQVTEEGCHYVHDGRILDPDRPMEWHHIGSGDEIEFIPIATD